MIMVTHDVGLKCYADRVVKIVDGKISNIEVINPALKKESIKTLESIVSGVLKPEEAEFILGVRSGMVQNLQNVAQQQHTTLEQKQRALAKSERRKPQDYAVVRYGRNFAE
jgi:putative ABC transport system ATP-binding protein